MKEPILTAEKLIEELNQKIEPQKKEILQRFFKTGKGEYGEGDVFIGVSMPNQRKIARKYKNLSFQELKILMDSKVHEHRMTALVILTFQFTKNKKEVYEFYISNINSANNWDLIDVTAPKVIGEYLFENKKQIDPLYEFAKSEDLWKKRISIISTFAFIRKKEFQDTINIAKILLYDKHDLIQKATGWMLREIGNRDEKVLINFLNKNYKTMPRTMLRYSIEKLEENLRQEYLKK